MRKSLWVIVLFMIPSLAVASGDDLTNISKNENDLSAVTGDVSVSGDSNKAFGFGYAMGDVDINQCLGSTQWTTILGGKQKLVINWPCMAEFYLKNGSPELAAMALCNTEILEEFEDEQECELAHSFLGQIGGVPTTPPTPPVADEETPSGAVGEVSEWGDGPSPGVELVQMEIETLEQRVARIEKGNKIAAQKSQERRDYAQMTIKRLENDPEE